MGVSLAGQDDGDVQLIFKISTHIKVGQALLECQKNTTWSLWPVTAPAPGRSHTWTPCQYGLNEIHVGETVRTRVGQSSAIILTVKYFRSVLSPRNGCISTLDFMFKGFLQNKL